MSNEELDPALDLAKKTFLLTMMATVICIAAVIAWMM